MTFPRGEVALGKYNVSLKKLAVKDGDDEAILGDFGMGAGLWSCIIWARFPKREGAQA